MSVREGINTHKKLYEALLQTKIKYIDVSKCNELNVVEVSHTNKKKKKRNPSQLIRKKGSQQGKLLECDSSNIALLPNSPSGNMGWLMDTYIEMVDMLLNYIHFLQTGNWKRYLEVLF